MKKFVLLLTALLWIDTASAKVKLANVFTHHMVLQQGKPLKIWGTADAGESISVRIGQSKTKTVAGSDGRWSVCLESLNASFKPVRFVVKGSRDKIELTDVLVGEVWLASGQSNMEYSMNNHPQYAKPRKGNPDRLLQEYEQASNPMIRLLYVRKELNSDTLPTVGWQRVGRESLKPFSAAAYFFAKSLQDSLEVPVGVVSSSWGGTMIETWTPVEMYRESPLFADKMKGNRLQTNGEIVGRRYDKMIKPLAPMALRGFLWYQGESNLIKGDTDIYTEKMRLLVGGWRKAWGDTLLPMYYVQISPLLYSGRKQDIVPKNWQDLPKFWEAQARCMEVIPHTGMIVTTDIPEDLSDIHPPYKWVVGERLAKWALNRTYGKRHLVCSAPVLSHIKTEGDSIVMDFENVGTGLVTRDGKAPDWFYALSRKNTYIHLQATLRDGKVYVNCSNLPQHTVLRLGWDEIAQPNLMNSEGLPVLPFCVDYEIGCVYDCKIAKK